MTTITIKIPAQEVTFTVDNAGIAKEHVDHYVNGFVDLMLAPNNEGWREGLERIDTGSSISGYSIEVK